MDLSEFEALSTTKLLPCRVGLALDKLEPEERKLFERACASRETVSTGALSKWLVKRGHEVKVGSAVAHRAKTCSCYGRS